MSILVGVQESGLPVFLPAKRAMLRNRFHSIALALVSGRSRLGRLWRFHFGLEMRAQVAIVAERPGARLPAAAQGDLVLSDLKGVAVAIQQDQPFRVLDVVRAIFLCHNYGFCLFSHANAAPLRKSRK